MPLKFQKDNRCCPPLIAVPALPKQQTTNKDRSPASAVVVNAPNERKVFVRWQNTIQTLKIAL